MELRNKRTGLIARKVGMTQLFDEDGSAIAVTLLDVSGNHVLGHKTKEKDGYSALVLAFDRAKESRINKAQKAVFAKAKVPASKKVREFRITDSSYIDVGSQMSANHFVEGQFVDIQGNCTGKGFAGPMKRWNFRGLEATHGVSISHRSHGSTGQRQDPGRTFKGKKMAGHMGTEVVTLQNLEVVLVDEELGVIAVHGSVPGKTGSYVYVTDSVKLGLPSSVVFPGVCTKAEESAAKANEVKTEQSNEISVEAKESSEQATQVAQENNTSVSE